MLFLSPRCAYLPKHAPNTVPNGHAWVLLVAYLTRDFPRVLLNMPATLNKCGREGKKRGPEDLDPISAHRLNLILLTPEQDSGSLQLLTNDVIIPFLLTDNHAFLITGHVLTGRTLGTGGSGGQQWRPPTGC